MATHKEKETAMSEKEQAIAESLVEKAQEIPWHKQTLATLLGGIAAEVIANRASLPASKKKLELWYMAQDDKDRKALAQRARRDVETFKLLGESLFMTLVEISSGDQ